MKYDFLIIGAGLSGSTFAYLANKAGYSCLVIDKESYIGGHCATENIEGIHVHKYGAHILNTNNKHVFDFISQFTSLNHFINSPIANYKGELYNMPINMNTFYQLWGTKTPEEAKAEIERQRIVNNDPLNLEDHLLNIAGTDIYEKIFKHYTEKQWGRSCKELPPEIIARIPFRFTFDNNYSNAIYQGVPVDGYTAIFNKMLKGINVVLEAEYFDNRDYWNKQAESIVFTGAIDEYFDYKLGQLEYRSLRFETEILKIENFQGNAVMNFTDAEHPYTRITEHKHFNFGKQDFTVISYEYPDSWEVGKERYYPIIDKKNLELYREYEALAAEHTNIYFLGRLAQYAYTNMSETIQNAFLMFKKITER